MFTPGYRIAKVGVINPSLLMLLRCIENI